MGKETKSNGQKDIFDRFYTTPETVKNVQPSQILPNMIALLSQARELEILLSNSQQIKMSLVMI